MIKLSFETYYYIDKFLLQNLDKIKQLLAQRTGLCVNFQSILEHLLHCVYWEETLEELLQRLYAEAS